MQDYERSGFVGGLLFASAIPMFFFKAFVLATLWGWFLVESIGVEPITTLQSAGLIIFWGLLTMKYFQASKEEETEKISWLKLLVSGWISPAMSLGFGWVINFFM